MKQKSQSKIIIVSLLVVITALHYLNLSGSWPIHDFYRRFYYLPIILASFWFRIRGGFIISLVVALLYAPHLLFYFGEINIAVINQFLEVIMFMVVGLITGYLVEKDYRKRVLLEEQLVQIANLENYTHNILDSLDSGVVALNLDLQIQSINQRGKTMFSEPMKIAELIQEHGLISMVRQVSDLGIPEFQREIILTDQGESQCNLQIQGYPLRNFLGEIEGVVLVIHDITQIKQLEQQVKRSERLTAIGQLASGIAHEIRNPLGIIKTISQTMVYSIKEPEQQESLEIIQQEIDRANGVIQELLDYAKPYGFERSEISLQEVVKELLMLIQAYGEQHKVRIEAHLLLDCVIEGNSDKLKQAFINLVMNGIQAMDQGGRLSITLKEERGLMAVLSFSDEGRGIAAENIDRIFNPFFTTRDEGTGLGLGITQRIIEAHGGEMEIKSQIGVGTEVVVRIPLARREEQ